jgi:hypothetical protein
MALDAVWDCLQCLVGEGKKRLQRGRHLGTDFGGAASWIAAGFSNLSVVMD